MTGACNGFNRRLYSPLFYQIFLLSDNMKKICLFSEVDLYFLRFLDYISTQLLSLKRCYNILGNHFVIYCKGFDVFLVYKIVLF